METANRRNAAMAMGTLPRFAGGGLIEGFKKAIGITPESPELKAYKERAAAERAGKAAKPAAQVMAEPPKSAIGDYVGNSALDKRMKAADAMASGGPIKGPGTGTSDDVPIMASNGEFMVRKAAVDVVGTEVLEAINALGEDQSTADDPEDKQPGQYAVGGVVDEQPSEYGRQMREVGNFFTQGAGSAFKTLVSAPGYGLSDQPKVGAVAGTAPTPTPAPAPARVAAAPSAPAAPIAGGATPSVGSRNPASGSPDETAATDGSVKVDRQANGNLAFSGKDISGTPQYTGSAASRMASTKGNLSVVPGMSQEKIDRTLTNPDGSRWSDADNATMAANIRDGVDPTRGTQRGMAAEKMAVLQGLALSPNGTPGKSNAVKILAMQSDERRTAATQQTERDKLALTAKGAELDNTGKQQTLDAQRALTEAKTPAERRSAMEVLAGLQGRMTQAPQDEYAYAPGGQEVTPAGATLTRPGVIFNKRTGAINAPPQAQSGLPSGLVVGAATKQPDGTYDADGTRVVIKNGKVVEIK